MDLIHSQAFYMYHWLHSWKDSSRSGLWWTDFQLCLTCFIKHPIWISQFRHAQSSILIFVTNPLYIFPKKNLDLILKLEEMSAEMNQQCESSCDSPHQPKRGEVCLAKFAEGGLLSNVCWYCIGSLGSLVAWVNFYSSLLHMKSALHSHSGTSCMLLSPTLGG